MSAEGRNRSVAAGTDPTPLVRRSPQAGRLASPALTAQVSAAPVTMPADPAGGELMGLPDTAALRRELLSIRDLLLV
jgi:hypothetical protein